jgi:hypothetical protein
MTSAGQSPQYEAAQAGAKTKNYEGAGENDLRTRN